MTESGHKTDSATPPIAKRVETRREFHGDVFIDPYEWLRDKSEPRGASSYLEAENDYADQTTAISAVAAEDFR